MRYSHVFLLVTLAQNQLGNDRSFLHHLQVYPHSYLILLTNKFQSEATNEKILKRKPDDDDEKKNHSTFNLFNSTTKQHSHSHTITVFNIFITNKQHQESVSI